MSVPLGLPWGWENSLLKLEAWHRYGGGRGGAASSATCGRARMCCRAPLTTRLLRLRAGDAVRLPTPPSTRSPGALMTPRWLLGLPFVVMQQCPLSDNAVVEASLSCLARTFHHGIQVWAHCWAYVQDISPTFGFQCCDVCARLPISIRMYQPCGQNKADDCALANCCRSSRPSQMRQLPSGTHTQGSSCRGCAATPAGHMCWSATL